MLCPLNPGSGADSSRNLTLELKVCHILVLLLFVYKRWFSKYIQQFFPAMSDIESDFSKTFQQECCDTHRLESVTKAFLMQSSTRIGIHVLLNKALDFNCRQPLILHELPGLLSPRARGPPCAMHSGCVVLLD